MPDVESYANAFPLARSGGLFLLLMGIALLAGSFRFRSRNLVLGIGVAIASVATAATAFRLTAPHGAPTREQIAWLAGAVVLEVVLIAIANRRYMPRSERTAVVAALFIVGLHFLPMTPAFGQIVAALGLFGMANAAVAWRSPAYTLSALWAVDGAGKLAAGAALLFSHLL